MIEVTIADVTEHRPSQHYAVVLLDKVGRRILVILVGEPEAWAIAIHLLEQSMPRPLTHDFMASLLEVVGVELEEVRIEALRDTTYYAVTKLRSGDTVQEVDTRPSDAIALAVRMDSPIYVAEEVLEKSGIDIPEGIGLTPRRRGLDEIKEKIGEAQSTEVQRLIDFLFGEEA